jgi:hypothetical protein
VIGQVVEKAIGWAIILAIAAAVAVAGYSLAVRLGCSLSEVGCSGGSEGSGDGFSFIPNITWPDWDFNVTSDTVFVKGPVRYRDRWHERVIYRDAEADTVTVVEYLDSPPPTVELVSAAVGDDGVLQVEVMVNDSNSVVLSGKLGDVGDTHVVVDKDSSLHFATERFGFDSNFTAGPYLGGLGGSLELFAVDDFPMGDAVTRFPCLALQLGWRSLGGERPVSEDAALAAHVAVEPWPKRSSVRVNLGGAYFARTHEIGFDAGLTFELARLF